MPLTKTVFLFHGSESSPRSRKMSAMAAIARRCRWKTIVPDHSGIFDPDERVRRFLEDHEKPSGQVVMAGSSMGGYVALEASRNFAPDALLLLAPAVYIDGYANQDPRPGCDRVTVVHGRGDTLIEPSLAVRFSDQFATELHLLNDGHDLGASVPFVEQTFKRILESCSGASHLSELVPTL